MKNKKLHTTPPIIFSPVRYARVIAAEFPIGNPSLFTKFVALPKNPIACLSADRDLSETQS